MSAKDVQMDEAKPTYGCGLRHVQAAMLFFAMVICFAMRVNISMAIVAMTDSTKENSFDWSVQKQSVILSSFFWGYVVLQIPGGELAARFGGKILITVCVGINSVTTLIIPIVSFYMSGQVFTCNMNMQLSRSLTGPEYARPDCCVDILSN